MHSPFIRCVLCLRLITKQMDYMELCSAYIEHDVYNNYSLPLYVLTTTPYLSYTIHYYYTVYIRRYARQQKL